MRILWLVLLNAVLFGRTPCNASSSYDAPLLNGDAILVGAPGLGAFYNGLCCSSSSAAQFTLSTSVYVTTIDVVLASSAVFDFSLQTSLSDSRSALASARIRTRTDGPSVESISVHKRLSVGTYYLVGSKDPASSTRVPGWYASDGVLVTNAGSVANGIWVDWPSRPWAFSSGIVPDVSVAFAAPMFAVKTLPTRFPTVIARLHECKVSGTVTGKFRHMATNLKIVLYAHTDRYYIQPCSGASVRIRRSGRWGPTDSHPGELYAVLVRSDYIPVDVIDTLPGVDGVDVVAMTGALGAVRRCDVPQCQ